ncbi:hypothetical protein [Pseudomonas urethralis]|uniref:hypothetical protein n=1 Tax=Pseudomonas urethralis TaxID=2740517 RepID=UPI001596BAF8|nr:hypothetical protein [Pseudomonas urethralis]
MGRQGFPINVPVPADYRYAVYCGSTLVGLRHDPEDAVALFKDKRPAEIFGGQMWPGTFAVIDLESYRNDDQEQVDR